MIIKVTDRFEKRLAKLSSKIRKKVYFKLDIFKQNPFNPVFKNHSLRGVLDSKRAISVTGDIRIIFMEENNYEIVYLLDIGTHNQVY